MFKTLLVDDEARALSGIERTFRWADYGFTVVYSTTDPVAALEYLRANEVDIAFVDIRMPELSGLDIVRISQEEGLSTRFVIVSGYSEFEFAREALRRGVIDYCLKPIRDDAATSLLERAAKRLRQEEVGEQPGIESMQFDPAAVRKQFSDPYPFYCAAVCISDDTGEETLDSNSLRFLDGNRVVSIRGADELIFVINLEGGNPRSMLGPRRGAWRVGFGKVRSDIASIPASIQEARAALSARLFYPERRVFSCTPTHLPIIDAIASELRNALGNGMIFTVESFFENLPTRIRGENLMPWDVRTLEERFLDKIGAAEMRAQPSTSRTVETIEAFASRMRLAVLKAICPEAGRAFSVPASNTRVWEMLQFVHQNIESRVTLAELSERYHFHPNYGCELFKKHTGMTFSQYVIRMKLWHARNLLSRSDTSIADVAERVGYDYYHFNRLFKRIEGVTPKSYRASVLP